MNTDPYISFFFPGSELGVLLIHGYLTGPDEMRLLGEHLAASGFTVLGLCLRGHGTRAEALREVVWQDWVTDVTAGLEQLRGCCARVSLAGLSLGAALAFYTAACEPIERIVAFSAPDSTLARRAPGAWAECLAPLIPSIPKIGSDVRDPVMRRRHFTYPRIYLRSVAQVVALFRQVDESLPHVTAPTLLVYSRNDRVVPPRTARRIAQQLAGPAQLLELQRGGHTVVMDYDRERAFAAAQAWLSGDDVV